MELVSRQSKGENNTNDWLKEGYQLLCSAKTIRTSWQGSKLSVKSMFRKHQAVNSIKLWASFGGLPRASTLILGYATELILKSIITKQLCFCSTEYLKAKLFEFGHSLPSLAEAVDLNLDAREMGYLRYLESAIKCDARYPVEASGINGGDYFRKVNERNVNAGDDSLFNELYLLASRIYDKARRVDCDTRNPVLFKSYKLGELGYVTLRIGGGLSGRATVRYPVEWLGLDDPKAELEKTIDRTQDHFFQRYWGQVKIFEDEFYPQAKKKDLVKKARRTREDEEFLGLEMWVKGESLKYGSSESISNGYKNAIKKVHHLEQSLNHLKYEISTSVMAYFHSDEGELGSQYDPDLAGRIMSTFREGLARMALAQLLLSLAKLEELKNTRANGLILRIICLDDLKKLKALLSKCKIDMKLVKECRNKHVAHLDEIDYEELDSLVYDICGDDMSGLFKLMHPYSPVETHNDYTVMDFIEKASENLRTIPNFQSSLK